MKILAILLTVLIFSPVVSARLTDEDLYRISQVLNERIEKLEQRINQRIDDTNKRIDDMRTWITVLGLLIIASSVIPPAIFYRRDRDSAVQKANTERDAAIVEGKAAAMQNRKGFHSGRGM